jgi:hypothetical protein
MSHFITLALAMICYFLKVLTACTFVCASISVRQSHVQEFSLICPFLLLFSIAMWILGTCGAASSTQCVTKFFADSMGDSYALHQCRSCEERLLLREGQR